MWLKAVTVVLMLFSVAMLFAYFWVVGPKPPSSAPRAEQIAFLRRGAAYVGIEAAALIGSLVGAYLIARRARQEYRDQSQRNLEALIESTLRDHAKKEPDADADL
jgi:Na+/glutamate symporter